MIRLRETKGFTLVETIIAVVLIAIALITMAAAFTNAASILQRSRHTLTAVGQLQKWVEFYRNSSFSDITTCTDTSLTPVPAPYSLQITTQLHDADNADGDNDDSTGTETDIKKVSLKIFWDERGSLITKKMTTLITENGINP